MPSRCLVSLAVCCTLAALPSPGSVRAQPRPPASCDRYRAAVEADAKNLDAAARLGQCSFRDYEMIAPGGDSSRLAFRSSWATALRALRHTVELDPGYAPAYRPLFSILFAETRDGCSFATGACSHVASIVRDGDSVITTPKQVGSGSTRVDPYEGVLRESRAKARGNIVEARSHAERWAAVAPNDWQPHEYLGRALLWLGDPVAAVDELERSASLGDAASRRTLFWDRFEALVKSDRGADARRVLDEAFSDPARDTTRLRNYTEVGLNAIVGRSRQRAMSPADSARMKQMVVRADSMRRNHLLPAPTTRPSPSSLLAAGDTAGARRELAHEDSLLPPRTPIASSSFGFMTYTSATQHLALGDTAGAIARLAEVEQAFNDRPFQFHAVLLAEGLVLGRVWVLTGDLAAAQRRFDEAARMYRRIVGLWGGGDRDVQPLVDDARAKLERLPVR